MKAKGYQWVVCLVVLSAFGAWAGDQQHREWTVDGETREALVVMPEAADAPPPLVFVFHGHGGSIRNSLRTMAIHEHWPEAVVVYMQGLPTPGQLTDPDGKRNGWNCDPKDSKNRDLAFFDAVYASLKDQVDTDRVYCTGHSNGGSFTYMLWGVRGDLFAAIAPSGALNPKISWAMDPVPVLHIAGKNDPLVKYAWQDKMMQAVRKINGCAEATSWHSAGTLTGTLYPSDDGAPMVTLIHPGGHRYPKEAPELIVRFFKAH